MVVQLRHLQLSVAVATFAIHLEEEELAEDLFAVEAEIVSVVKKLPAVLSRRHRAGLVKSLIWRISAKLHKPCLMFPESRRD